MIKKCLVIIFLIGLQSICLSQNKNITDSISRAKIDSLKQQLLRVQNDSSRIRIIQRIGFDYEVLNLDSSMKYTQAALDLSRI